MAASRAERLAAHRSATSETHYLGYWAFLGSLLLVAVGSMVLPRTVPMVGILAFIAVHGYMGLGYQWSDLDGPWRLGIWPLGAIACAAASAILLAESPPALVTFVAAQLTGAICGLLILLICVVGEKFGVIV